MTTNPLDAIQARADLAQGAWEEFNLGIATTRFALDEANNSAEDVPRLLAALRAVEAVCADLKEEYRNVDMLPLDSRRTEYVYADGRDDAADQLRAAIREALS